MAVSDFTFAVIADSHFHPPGTYLLVFIGLDLCPLYYSSNRNNKISFFWLFYLIPQLGLRQDINVSKCP